MTKQEKEAEAKKEAFAYLKRFLTDYSKGKEPASKEEILRKQRRNETASLAVSPSEYMAPYYGGKEGLAREMQRAVAYRNSPAADLGELPLSGDKRAIFSTPPEERIFDIIDLDISPRQVATYSYNRDPNNPEPKVEAYGKEGADIYEANARTYQKHLKSKDPSVIKEIEEAIYGNEYSSPDRSRAKGDKALSSAVEHELGHHVYRPNRQGLPNSLTDTYFSNESEMLQGIGRLQREIFKQTGSRLTKPDDLYKLIKSGDELDFLSPEGSRIINYLRKHEGLKGGDEYIKTVSKIAPAFVKNEKDDFASVVESRLT